MLPPDSLPFHFGVVLIDLIGGLLMMPHIISALVTLLRGESIGRARLLVAEGAVLALSFKTAGTLLKTLELHTWNQILMFGVILTLRISLKKLFVWEKGRVMSSPLSVPKM